MSIKKCVHSSFFAALTAVLSFITVPIGPVPFTLQLIAVYLSGLLLGGKAGAVSQGIYLLLGMMGLPVFSGFTSGIGMLAGPTGGYLISYMAVAYLTGSIASILPFQQNFIRYTIACLAGLLVCYSIGSFQLSIVQGLSFFQALSIGVFPFILPDFLKITVTTMMIPKIKPIFENMGFRG